MPPWRDSVVNIIRKQIGDVTMVQTEDEVAEQTFIQMFHSLSSSWLCLLLCENDAVSQ